MKFTHDFAADLAAIDFFSKEPFALVRFADGERAILERRDIPTADGWCLPDTQFTCALLNSLDYDDSNYHVGISCSCCDPDGRASLLEHRVEKRGMLTFSNIFANANWVPFLEKCKVAPPHSIGWVGPYSAGAIPRFLYPLAWVPKNLVNDPLWHDKIDTIVAKMRFESANGPIFVSAGPAAKIIIHEYWKRYSDKSPQTVIDIGSALDPYIHGRPTRGYHHEGHPNQRKVCVWS